MFGPNRLNGFLQFLAEHMPIEEEQGIEGLVLGSMRKPSPGGLKRKGMLRFPALPFPADVASGERG